jgi:hypothetical protein
VADWPAGDEAKPDNNSSTTNSATTGKTAREKE